MGRWIGFLVYVVAVLLPLGLVLGDKDVQLEIPQGQLKGLRVETRYQSKPYYSFRGIPYAQPTVGPDKFRLAEPAEPWEGVHDATYYREPCPFFCNLKKGFVGDEDCHYLNVFTPTLDKDARKAVMVYIHPGGFNGGLSDDQLWGPDFLLEQDVIVVTFSFRQGPLGFLNTGDKNAPGNNGMKDQVMALKWVKDNIHYFGGCPDRVTLFGECSGASSVQYHMLSPMSEGLFSAAIMQSGSAFDPHAITHNPREMAFKLGEALDIQTTDTAELVQKLATFEAKDLIKTALGLVTDEETVNGHLYVFVPSIEADLGQDMFLTDSPWSLLKAGKVADVPVMLGATSDEGDLHGRLMGEAISILRDHPEMFVPIDLNLTGSDLVETAQMIKKFYLGDKEPTIGAMKEFSTLIGDIFFLGGLTTVDALSKKISSPIYEYEFAYKAPYGFWKLLYPPADTDAAHGDDLYYLWYAEAFKNLPEPGSAHEKMMHIITKLWTNFAKDRNPTSNLDENITVNWEPRGADDNYLIIDETLKMDKEIMKDRVDFWRGLYKDALN